MSEKQQENTGLRKLSRGTASLSLSLPGGAGRGFESQDAGTSAAEEPLVEIEGRGAGWDESGAKEFETRSSARALVTRIGDPKKRWRALRTFSGSSDAEK